MRIANINRFIQHISGALDALHATVSMPQAEQLAVLAHSAMESARRRYHSSGHALYMCEDMNPRQVLAAVFHDMVYYQLDDGFPLRVAHLLQPLVGKRGDDLFLRDIAADDCAMQLCLELFDFQAGQVLPLFRGMNEFLSAAVAVRLLQPYLSLADLIAVLACIEATIPFRGPEADGRDCSMALAERVRAQALARLGMQAGAELDQFVDSVMADAIGVANRDVGGFAEDDPARFVSVTWLLIEESNAPLASVGVYTLQDYREALTRMQGFLAGLQAERVFHHYDDQPPPAEFLRLTRAAGGNIAFALAFLRLKMTSISVIEALALETGGNGPVSMFLGDIRSHSGTPERVEDYLPAGPNPADLDAKLLHVLEQGRPEDSRNDLTVSPLTAYMYRCLGVAGSLAAQQAAARRVSGELSAFAFLSSLPRDMLLAIIDACARIALSRRDGLLSLRARLLAQP
jgi:hypothetical protein